MVQSEAGDWVAYEDHLAAELRFEELEGELCKLLPGVQYMDPPDGGSVTPIEQVRRMIADLKKQNEINEALLYAMRQDMRESREKMEAMLGENVALKKFISDECFVSRCGVYEEPEEHYYETPATDAIANELRAEAALSAIIKHRDEINDELKSKDTSNRRRESLAFAWAKAESFRVKIESKLRAGNVEGGE